MFIRVDSESYADFLDNPLFHHKDNGCELETLVIKTSDKTSLNQVCHTHGKLCSKTGWEIHHYLGNDNRSFYFRTCRMCGTKFETKNYRATNKNGVETFYCECCQKKVNQISGELLANVS